MQSSIARPPSKPVASETAEAVSHVHYTATLSRGTIVSWVRIAAISVIALGLIREFYVYSFGENTFFQEMRQFDLDDEANIPTWFSSMLMFMISILSLFIFQNYRDRDRMMRWGWCGLSVAFLALSIEEAAGFHEALMVPLRHGLGVGGIFHYAWVIPAIVLVLAFVAVYVPFLLRIPMKFRLLFIVAGGIYVTGALGFEMIGGLIASRVGEDVYYYGFVTFIEETLEIIGLTMFFGAVLDYFIERGGRVEISTR